MRLWMSLQSTSARVPNLKSILPFSHISRLKTPTSPAMKNNQNGSLVLDFSSVEVSSAYNKGTVYPLGTQDLADKRKETLLLSQEMRQTRVSRKSIGYKTRTCSRACCQNRTSSGTVSTCSATHMSPKQRKQEIH